MQKLIWVDSKGNSVDLTSGNYGITNWEGFSNTSLNIQSQQVPFHDGGVFLDALLEQRELSVTLAIQDSGSLETRYRLRRELIHILNPKSGEGYLIYKNDFTEKRIKCISQIPLFENHNSNDSGTPKASLSWTACEPYWEDLEPVKVVCQQGIINLIDNLGEENAQVKVRITGNAKNPKITNLTTNKSISYEGEVDGVLHLDTTLGNKSIIQDRLNIIQKYNYNTINDVNFINGYFYLVTNKGECFRTEDGVTFTLLFKESDLRLYRIKYFEGSGIFITGNHLLMYSSDGENFTKILDVKYSIYDIAYNGSVYVVTKGLSQLNVSSDLETWEVVNLPQGYDINANNIDYGNGVFVIADKHRLISSDGYNWTLATTYSVKKTRLKFINGYFFTLDSDGKFDYSANGDNWKGYYLSGGDSLVDIIYDEKNRLYITVTSTGVIYTTTNFLSDDLYGARNWTVITVGVTSDITSLSCNANIYIVCGEGGRRYTGNDLTQLERSIGIDKNFDIFDVAYSSKLNKYVAVVMDYDTVNTYYLLKSNDGVDWEYQRLVRVLYCEKIIWVNDFEKFYICGYYGVTYSSNTQDWIASSVTSACYDIYYNEKTKTLIAITNDGKVYTSTDGVNFTKITTNLPKGNYKTYVCYNDNQNKYFVTRNKKIYSSSDLITYTEIKILDDDFVGRIFYVKEINIIIVMAYNNIYVTSDGMKWTNIEIGITAPERSKVIYNIDMNLIILICSSGVHISADGYHWNQISTQVVMGGTFDTENNSIYVGIQNTILFSEIVSENKIINLGKDSDVNFNLDLGQNEIIGICDEGIMNFELTYTPKYIGV